MFQSNPFDMSIRHQRGMWVLLIASILIIFAPRFFLFFQRDESATKLILLPIEEKSKFGYQEKQHRWKSSYKKRTWSRSKKAFKKPTKPFNPNELSQEEWMQFGLSEKQASIVLKFTKRGITSNEELQKIKFIPKETFENIKDFTQYPPLQNEKIKAQKLQESNELFIVNANSTSEEDLMKINGIGPALSERILNEKNKFGSFVSMEQMKDIWGLSPDVIEKLNHSFKIASLPNVKKIKINDASIKELMQLLNKL